MSLEGRQKSKHDDVRSVLGGTRSLTRIAFAARATHPHLRSVHLHNPTSHTLSESQKKKKHFQNLTRVWRQTGVFSSRHKRQGMQEIPVASYQARKEVPETSSSYSTTKHLTPTSRPYPNVTRDPARNLTPSAKLLRIHIQTYELNSTPFSFFGRHFQAGDICLRGSFPLSSFPSGRRLRGLLNSQHYPGVELHRHSGAGICVETRFKGRG